MTLHVSKSEIYQALGQASHPEIQGRNLVELGMIPEVMIEEDRVHVVLALPSLEAPIKEELIEAVRLAVAQITEGLHVEVRLMEMTEAQKATFQSVVREELRVAPRIGVNVGRVLAVMSGKGGVGKSSVAGLLASSLRKRGYRVGVLDADITGPSIPKMFGVHQLPTGGPEGIDPIESRMGIKLMSINFLLPDEDQPVVAWTADQSSDPAVLERNRLGQSGCSGCRSTARDFGRLLNSHAVFTTSRNPTGDIPSGSGRHGCVQSRQHGSEFRREVDRLGGKHELYPLPEVWDEDRSIWRQPGRTYSKADWNKFARTSPP
jgi:metal-sulfur cluster biosynthetic enzyme